MNDAKLNEYLNEYGKNHNPEPSRELVDKIMRIPYEVEQKSVFSWNFREWTLFLVPRLSGLTAACVMGIYVGGTGSTALAEDEIAVLDGETFAFAENSIVLDENADTLLDVEDFIFVEESAQ